MTRPSEIKPREGSVPGTPYDDSRQGAELDPVEFTITPALVDEYMAAASADPELYRVDGRQASPPNVLLTYMTAIIYRKYPPIQGIVMAELDVSWHGPIWVDESTEIKESGKVIDKFIKRGRPGMERQALLAAECQEL
jgi:hypothetical protein